MFLKGYGSFSITKPIWLFLTLVGVKGDKVSPGRLHWGSLDPIDRDILHLPETVIESSDQPASDLLRPSFDLIWTAADHPRAVSVNA